VFLGAVYEERADLLASARACVLPARSGSFSIIVLEALAAGVPVVATPFVAGWQSERHFDPVRVCADFTPEALAEALARELAQAPAARIAEGKRIAAGFDWSQVAGDVEYAYADAIAVRQRASGDRPRALPVAAPQALPPLRARR